MDYLHIDDITVLGKHGVYDAERNVEQEFKVSVKLAVDTRAAGASDKLEDTINYTEAKNTIIEIIRGRSRYLVEALAEDVAQKILEDKRVLSVEITIKKTAVWDNGVPGVTITRSNS